MRKRPLLIVLAVQLVLGATFLVLVASGALLPGDDEEPKQKAARIDRFDGPAAFRLLKRQVEYGPRPAGSAASRKLARELRRLMPNGRFQRVPKGLRNVVGTVKGKQPRRYIVVGAHYDTKDLEGFVGANDGAGGTAAVVQLARQLKPRTIGPTVKFVLFDGEEAPRGRDSQFERYGLRGSKVAARAYRKAEAMILLDFIADKRLSIPREGNSDIALWAKLRRAAKRVGAGRHFPNANTGPVSDDHLPFLRRGVPSIDLIDFDFPCWHQTCDDLTAVSEKSLDASGESVAELLRTLD